MINKQAILNKFNGHCAYCGCIVNLQTMQVDHKLSKRSGGGNDIDNLFPACRACNHYKRSGDIEYLRNLLLDMYRKLRKIYIFRIAEKYEMINWKEWDGKFYYEKYK
jgi:5-methylcytosine-specific restriction endonuclease McrA